ncbi:uncharacterized protein UV8b_07170 [Ustilaginoidea virens]|uniref:Uncharacterized protein n=1 Tax=Ustilaginoidea virens TaxID=1159556 RepID=A0A8E5HWL7_USTVR|nr:uncharacterized protein UV8b_07170 [Ustilaginoidea virens]QUC22929.1 hypothetical protein UV8b_07170 [Ustilaginoidea virens]
MFSKTRFLDKHLGARGKFTLALTGAETTRKRSQLACQSLGGLQEELEAPRGAFTGDFLYTYTQDRSTVPRLESSPLPGVDVAILDTVLAEVNGLVATGPAAAFAEPTQAISDFVLVLYTVQAVCAPVVGIPYTADAFAVYGVGALRAILLSVVRNAPRVLNRDADVLVQLRDEPAGNGQRLPSVAVADAPADGGIDAVLADDGLGPVAVELGEPLVGGPDLAHAPDALELGRVDAVDAVLEPRHERLALGGVEAEARLVGLVPLDDGVVARVQVPSRAAPGALGAEHGGDAPVLLRLVGLALAARERLAGGGFLQLRADDVRRLDRRDAAAGPDAAEEPLLYVGRGEGHPVADLVVARHEDGAVPSVGLVDVSAVGIPRALPVEDVARGHELRQVRNPEAGAGVAARSAPAAHLAVDADGQLYGEADRLDEHAEKPGLDRRVHPESESESESLGVAVHLCCGGWDGEK